MTEQHRNCRQIPCPLEIAAGFGVWSDVFEGGGDAECKESSRPTLWPAGFCLLSLSAQLLPSPISHVSHGH